MKSGRSKNSVSPTFSRGEVATILGVTPLTIANREKGGKYPPARRDLNNYRVYSLNEVFDLQVITFGAIDPRTIMSALYDQGMHNTREVAELIDDAIGKRTAER